MLGAAPAVSDEREGRVVILAAGVPTGLMGDSLQPTQDLMGGSSASWRSPGRPPSTGISAD